MRIQKIICDRCKQEIKNEPVKFFAEKVDPAAGDFATRSLFEDLVEKDFCDNCADFIHEMVNTQCLTEPEKAKPLPDAEKKNTGKNQV